MDWTPINMYEKKWTCRNCGESVVRNAADGHPMFRCMYTPPAQAAEAVERVARALATFDAERHGACPDTNLGMNEGYYTALARAAIGAMGGGNG